MTRWVATAAAALTLGCSEGPLDPNDKPASGELSPIAAWLEVGDSLGFETGGQPVVLTVAPASAASVSGRSIRALQPGELSVEAAFPIGRRVAKVTVLAPTPPLVPRPPLEGLTEVSLLGVWAASPTESFAVGTDGVVIRTTDAGRTWGKVAVPSDVNFTAVWGSAPDNVFVVGSGGTVLHFDGATWRRQPTPTAEVLLDVWGLDQSHVYAVGVNSMLHFDGTAWRAMPGPPVVELWSVWGTAPNDLFAVGQNGDILRWDGLLWRRMASPTQYVMFGLSGLSSSDVYAAGIRGLVLHFDGTSWRPVAVPSSTDFFAVSARSANDIMVVGNNGTVLIYNGVAWTRAPQSASNENLRAIAHDGAGRTLVAGWAGTVIERGPTGWKTQTSSPILLASVTGADGASYAVGAAGTVLRRTAAGIERLAVPTRRDLYGIARRAGGGLMAVGDTGTVLISDDGRNWRLEGVPSQVLLRSIWADPADLNAVYVVGAGGTILRRHGGGWTVVPSPRPVFYRHVHGISAELAYAVGDSGSVVRLTAAGADTMSAPTTARLRSVWGTAPNDVVAVGENGVAIRYDGRRWYRIETGVAVELRALAGLGPTRMYAAGVDGTVLRFDGARFRALTSPTRALLLGATAADARVSFVGTGQTFLDLMP
ncbi:MAG: hypothetical protein FJ206_06915 [Gemmatimonadetes bacterium]|nr:hypothetical protein [Gemmatimonadota bacterium]